ncbi:MAG: thioredoxin domain-containing protein [bacterium]|nr:thioredoxin domain-containing protein [bacterium]
MNRLGAETSPYLRQHADNPVDWYPWGSEAFAAARAADKPVLLSVGYSACHWCHVMAHESFEDPETARVMNELFVNIKVDREERPDVDAIYMEAVQALTGRGGWPMTVFMTPDGRPFHGGTYYPKTSRGQMPSFTEIMHGVQSVWADRRTDVDSQADQITQSLNRTALISPDPRRASGGTGSEALGRAAAALRQHYDAAWGGFGGAPKFPQTMSHEVLLRSYLHSGDQDVLNMVITAKPSRA